jgi:hypothetical protein
MEDGKSSTFDQLLHGTVSPFLVAFVCWVLAEARKSGISRLYFVARDGQVLHKIASELTRGDSSIELRYLYGSRRAWLPPSITRNSTVWKRLVITPGQSNKYSDMLSRMGLESGQQIKIRKELGISEEAWNLPLSEQLAFQFLENIFSKKEISDSLLQPIHHLRQLALKYFSQEGLLDNVRWALVDAGWTLNCQAAIKRILSHINGKRPDPTGFYINLTNDHLDTYEAGVARSFIEEPGSIFSRRRVIIEHCFTPSTHTSTQSYEERNGVVVPVFGPELRNNDELEYAQRLHDIAIHYAHLVKANKNMENKLVACNVNIIRNAEKFISNPSKHDVKFMGNFGTIADLRHEKSFIQPLCKPLKLRELGLIIGTTFSRRKRFSNPAFMWLEGSCALSPIYIRLPIHLMLFCDSILSELKRWWHKKP